MSSHLYIEGSKTGPNSKEEQIRCREGFRKLLENAGFSKKMPRLSACGGRDATYKDFKITHAKCYKGDYVAMLIDSEDPVTDIEKTWAHLESRDAWVKPMDASDQQVLFMTTCMETLIVADREALRQHYGHKLQENILPSPHNLENRDRQEVFDMLSRATRDCSNAYSKGRRSFDVVGKLSATALRLLPSFTRIIRILNEKLPVS